MTSHEHEPQVEPKSKVKLVRNAKGDTQIEVSIVEGTTLDEAERIRQLAVDQYKALQSEFYGAAA